jgi:CRISPR-associated protein Cas6
MTDNVPEMIDKVFDLDGGTLPTAYPFALWESLISLVPELADEISVGVLPLRGTGNKEGLLLPKRAKMVLRLPTTLATHTEVRLAGKQLELSGRAVRLGAAKTRPIYPFPTLHAQLVTGSNDEVLFVEHINDQLGGMGIKGKLICGKRRTISDESRSMQGYSLVVHDLNPEASLHLQFVGLGTGRQFGCGIFVPSKVISGLSED